MRGTKKQRQKPPTDNPVYVSYGGVLNAWNGSAWTPLAPPAYQPTTVGWVTGTSTLNGLTVMNLGTVPAPFTRVSSGAMKTPGPCIIAVTLDFPGNASSSRIRQFIEVVSNTASAELYAREAIAGEDNGTAVAIVDKEDTIMVRAYSEKSGAISGRIRATVF